jgi:glycosyltransferase involved in cell wall biosynthesis
MAVVNPPVKDELFNFDIEDDKDYWVWCGRIVEPYKKVDSLVEIFNSLSERLVVIGDGPDRARIESKANSNISFVGFKKTQELSELLSGAKGLIYPSHEDFGMMPMEALALGTPVIISNFSGAFQLLRDNRYSIGIETLDKKSLVQAMTQLSEFSCSRKNIRDSMSSHTENHFANSFKQIWQEVAPQEI